MQGVIALALGFCVAASAAAQPTVRSETFLAYLLGDYVGTLKTVGSERGYTETLRVVARQDRGRATVSESFSLTADGAGWLWERRVRAGTVEQHERGALANGRLTRNDGDGKPPVLLATVPAGTVLPSMRGELIRAFDTRTSQRTAFPYLDPSRLRIVPAHLETCAVDATLRGAAHCVALRLDARSGDEAWQLDADRRALRIDAGFGGLPLRLDACAQNCTRSIPRPFDMIGSLVVASPYLIPKKLAQAKLRYLLVRKDGLPPVLVRTGEQAVVFDGARAVITICRECGTTQVETDESLAPFLRPNAWVRSDDPEVRRLADRAGRKDRSLDVRMAKLERLVRLRMRNDADFIGYADATQALRTGRGDCTEFAVLLAALARAQGIPARVAVGMAYSSRFSGRKDTFAPHAWVQVYDGRRWISFDAALEGFDSTHVALATGTGEPQEVFDAFLQLRQLRIEKLGAVVR